MQDILQRFEVGHILRPSLAPTLTKVRQVELEAGDCEGRLPLLILDIEVCPWYFERCWTHVYLPNLNWDTRQSPKQLQ